MYPRDSTTRTFLIEISLATTTPDLEVKLLAAAAGLQLLASRAAVQMYLNEAVFCWYQRLHANRTPDTEYGRAKVFLHNHHLCAAAIQFIAPPLQIGRAHV